LSIKVHGGSVDEKAEVVQPMSLGQPKVAQVQISSDELAAQIEKAVLEQVSGDRIVLPAMPKVAARAFLLLRKREFSVAEVAAVIETDPVVAARLVHLANSVAFATFNKLQSVQACVNRLGARELSFFLMETAAKQLVECHDPRIAQICDGVWEHSLAVAILSHDLVQAMPGLDAEAAYLAGLLHDIGRPVVAEMLLDAEGRLLGKRVDRWIMPSKWLGIIVRCQRTVGLAVTRAWTLPDAVSDAVAMCDQYDRGRPFRLANVVGLANALAEFSGHDLSAQRAQGSEADTQAETQARIDEGRELLGLDVDTIVGVMAALPARLAGRML
jgi:putative nucleotidyltransferase with HDIG domain